MLWFFHHFDTRIKFWCHMLVFSWSPGHGAPSETNNMKKILWTTLWWFFEVLVCNDYPVWLYILESSFAYVSTCKQLFDIIATDDRIKAQKKIWKIKMTQPDYQFHRNMSLVPQVWYCSSTDNQWKRTEKTKLEEREQLQKRRETADQHERTFLSVSNIDAIHDSADEKSD